MYPPDTYEEYMWAAMNGNGCTSCLMTTHTADNCPLDDELVVKVTARNDAGEKQIGYGSGPTTDSAVNQAVELICIETGDDSYVMDDWEAA